MLSKYIILLFAVFLALPSIAGECLLTEALKNPQLSANSDFWTELSQLSEKGKPSDHQIKILVEKHGGSFSQTTLAPATTVDKVYSYSFTGRAEKEIKGLPKNLKTELDEFIELATTPTGLHEIRNNPGRWNFEKVEQFGKNARTIRLNGGYRVLFDVTPDAVEIRRVNKGQIHGG